jgi:RES domain-containing protein
MRTTAWRIANKKHAATAFSGDGAKTYGGRWNPPGYAAIYAAQSISLAILEMLVHLDEDQDIQAYVIAPVEFDDTQITSLSEDNLPKSWASLPIGEETQLIGKVWLESMQSLVLKVPSCLVPQESNFIINPRHPAFPSLNIGQPQPLQIDPRLAAKLQ